MIMTRAILRINELEYDILKFNYKFQRDTDAKGRPYGNYYGGEILVQLESTDNIRLFQQMICKDVPTVDGSIEVLSGNDGICVRRIKFEEAYIYSYGEHMQSASYLPMTTTIAISPIRLDFNNKMIRLDRKWPRAPYGWQKYEEEEVKYAKGVSREEKKSMKIIDVYWMDNKNKKHRVLYTNHPVKLYIVMEEYIKGETVDFHFEENIGGICYSANCSGIVSQNGVVEIEKFQLKHRL